MRLGRKREESVNILTCVGDGEMVPWVLSRSLHPSALVCVFILCVCVCVYVYVLLVQGQQHDPHHFSPSGLVFSSASPLSPGSLPRCPHTPAHTQGLLGDAPRPDQLL